MSVRLLRALARLESDLIAFAATSNSGNKLGGNLSAKLLNISTRITDASSIAFIAFSASGKILDRLLAKALKALARLYLSSIFLAAISASGNTSGSLSTKAIRISKRLDSSLIVLAIFHISNKKLEDALSNKAFRTVIFSLVPATVNASGNTFGNLLTNIFKAVAR